MVRHAFDGYIVSIVLSIFNNGRSACNGENKKFTDTHSYLLEMRPDKTTCQFPNDLRNVEINHNVSGVRAGQRETANRRKEQLMCFRRNISSKCAAP